MTSSLPIIVSSAFLIREIYLPMTEVIFSSMSKKIYINNVSKLTAGFFFHHLENPDSLFYQWFWLWSTSFVYYWVLILSINLGSARFSETKYSLSLFVLFGAGIKKLKTKFTKSAEKIEKYIIKAFIESRRHSFIANMFQPWKPPSGWIKKMFIISLFIKWNTSLLSLSAEGGSTLRVINHLLLFPCGLSKSNFETSDFSVNGC